MRSKKVETDEITPDFKKRWAKLCVFCPDPFADDPKNAHEEPHVPWDVAEYAYLLPEGVATFCDDHWKVCRKHRDALEAQAEEALRRVDEAPF